MAVLIVYWTNTGNTGVIAESIKNGVESTGVLADLSFVTHIQAIDASRYDKIALGCPSMGEEKLEEFDFDPFYQALKPQLKDKKVVLFGSYGWGDGEYMDFWENDIKAAGAVLISEGFKVMGNPSNHELTLAEELGVKLAKS